MVGRLLSLLLIALLLAACGDGGGGADTPSDAAPEEIEGVIVAIDSERLGEVESFDLKDGDEIYTLYIDPTLEYPFPLGHLHEHLETAQPVRCKIDERGGKLYAETIDDA